MTPEDLLLVTARDFEVQSLLPRRCNTPEPGAVDATLQDFFFSRWCCLKDVFRKQFNLANEAAPNSLRNMSRHLGLPHAGAEQGRQSACMSENDLLARVTKELLKQDWKPVATAWRDKVSAQTQFLLPSRGDFVADATGLGPCCRYCCCYCYCGCCGCCCCYCCCGCCGCCCCCCSCCCYCCCCCRCCCCSCGCCCFVPDTSESQLRSVLIIFFLLTVIVNSKNNSKTCSKQQN
ncbi:unnamed protein product [Polarella glacialis]|uniref:Uncharacterized protein n=1 Tax=Polarella glacialis TaxID=89957 RepID=A0A813DVS2_POLGL|nr:unnamed protein product [Polarella glacialis]